ncbi:MAG: hypothetical protein U0235_16120 [Polyangiaceae bacterium]
MMKRRAPWRFTLALLFAAPVCTPSRAAASDVLPFVSPGVVYSVSPNDGKDGLGVEVSAGALVWGNSPGSDLLALPHFGGLYRGQHYSGEGVSFGRTTIALEAGIPILGVELGYGHRARDGGGSGVHVSPYITALGMAYAGPQILVPVDGAKVSWEINVGVKPVTILLYFLLGRQHGTHLF